MKYREITFQSKSCKSKGISIKRVALTQIINLPSYHFIVNSDSFICFSILGLQIF